MSEQRSIDRIAALLSLALQAEGVGSEPLEGAVKKHMENGFPVAEVLAALKGTDWRYVIQYSGKSLSLERRSSLISWYRELLEQAARHCETLEAVEVSDLSFRSLMRVLDHREQAGFDFQKVAIECTRVLRYLRPDDEKPDAASDVARLLGLVWDGAYEIEGRPGENEELRDKAGELAAKKVQRGKAVGADVGDL